MARAGYRRRDFCGCLLYSSRFGGFLTIFPSERRWCPLKNLCLNSNRSVTSMREPPSPHLRMSLCESVEVRVLPSLVLTGAENRPYCTCSMAEQPGTSYPWFCSGWGNQLLPIPGNGGQHQRYPGAEFLHCLPCLTGQNKERCKIFYPGKKMLPP